MNQTHRDQVKEAAKKRREYVRKKTEIWTHGLLGITLAIGFGAAGLFLLWWGFSGLDSWRTLLVYLVVFGGTALYGSFHCRTAVKEAKALPYVPPVAEQIAALPAEEVLLRGSDQPAATPEELLRPGVASGEEELG